MKIEFSQEFEYPLEIIMQARGIMALKLHEMDEINKIESYESRVEGDLEIEERVTCLGISLPAPVRKAVGDEIFTARAKNVWNRSELTQDYVFEPANGSGLYRVKGLNRFEAFGDESNPNRCRRLISLDIQVNAKRPIAVMAEKALAAGLRKKVEENAELLRSIAEEISSGTGSS